MKTATARPPHPLLIAIALLLSGIPLVHAQVGINTTSPTSDLEVNGSFAQAVTTITADATLTSATKSMVVCNNGSTNIMVTLPLVADCPGRIYTIKKGTGSTGSVHIMGTSSQTIDGNSSYMLMNNDESVTLFSNGTGSEWKTIGKSNEPFPMGEINYFSTSGTAFAIANQSTDGGVTNMVLCNPTTGLATGAMNFSSNNAGRLTYTGDRPKHFHIACTISTVNIGGGSPIYVFGIAKNGTVIVPSKVLQKIGGDIESTALHVAIEMSKNDYLELYAGNITNANDVTIHTMTLFALGMD